MTQKNPPWHILPPKTWISSSWCLRPAHFPGSCPISRGQTAPAPGSSSWTWTTRLGPNSANNQNKASKIIACFGFRILITFCLPPSHQYAFPMCPLMSVQIIVLLVHCWKKNLQMPSWLRAPLPMWTMMKDKESNISWCNTFIRLDSTQWK